MLSAICFNLDQSKILSSGNGSRARTMEKVRKVVCGLERKVVSVVVGKCQETHVYVQQPIHDITFSVQTAIQTNKACNYMK